MDGTIYKGIGGFYYVKTESGALLECKARGIFRKRGQKPLAGDAVRLGEEAGTYYIDEIAPRKNAFVRPPVSNVDRLLIVASTTDPAPSLLVIDKLTALAIDQEVEPVLVVTKGDLASPDFLRRAYVTSGIEVVCVGPEAPEDAGLEEVAALLKGRLSVLCGNSGVGKSTLLNALAPDIEREVGETSKKLGRGRHTTREVELFEVCGGLVADTPGFASLDIQAAASTGGHTRGSAFILADNLQLCFPEIKQRIGQCRFSGCTHLAETGCAVRAAVEAGEMAPGRYQSYVTLYEEARQAEKNY